MVGMDVETGAKTDPTRCTSGASNKVAVEASPVMGGVDGAIGSNLNRTTVAPPTINNIQIKATSVIDEMDRKLGAESGFR